MDLQQETYNEVKEIRKEVGEISTRLSVLEIRMNGFNGYVRKREWTLSRILTALGVFVALGSGIAGLLVAL